MRVCVCLREGIKGTVKAKVKEKLKRERARVPRASGDNLLNCYCYFYVKCSTAHTTSTPLYPKSSHRPPLFD